jgi:hypothetical protein
MNSTPAVSLLPFLTKELDRKNFALKTQDFQQKGTI